MTGTAPGQGADGGAGSAAPARAAQGDLGQRIKRWHARLGQGAPHGIHPLLRMAKGAALIRGERAQRIDQGLCIVLELAGRGLQPPPAGFAGVSLRPKVYLDLRVDGAGVWVSVGYYGAPPGERALAEARAALGESAYLQAEGADGGAVRLVQLHAEPPRSLALVMVEAGGQDFAVPMQFVREALPEDRAGAAGEPARDLSMAECLGLRPAASRRGRAARLRMAFGDDPLVLGVDAVLGHRRAAVHGTGPLLGAIPWLMGVTRGEDGAPVLVVHPRRLPAGIPNPDPPTGS